MPGAGLLSAAPMDSSPNPRNPFDVFSSFIHHHASRLSADLAARLDDGRRRLRLLATAAKLPPFAAASLEAKHAFDVALSADYVAKTLTGTPVYTVSNSNNEFVLVSDPNNGLKSLGLLCFRHEDAQALLAQVQVRQPVLGKGARVVPMTLDQVYMLKVEGIAFRFLPDPLQIKNALELKAADFSKGFDGVPVFQEDHEEQYYDLVSILVHQIGHDTVWTLIYALVYHSDLLVIKKKNKRYCPIYFQKEDIERELTKFSKTSRGSSASQHIMVGSLEDVLKKMEMNDKNSGWDDLIFIPPGKSYTEHINEVSA